MPQSSVSFGGQAVIEGVMMRGPRKMAVAVRRPTGDILVESEQLTPWSVRFPFLAWPFVRGVPNLIESLILGVRTLTFSAQQAAVDEGEEIKGWEMALTLVVAVALAVGLFIVLPTTVAHFLQSHMTFFWQNLLEGVVRLGVFLAYLVVIARLPDIQRVFQYHGAEHKVIHSFEAGEELTVERARLHSTLHPRCGTAFLLLVLVLTIFIYSLLPTPSLLARILSRVVLLPVVAGIGYELLKLSARCARHPWAAWVFLPGLWLQRLTTREPDDSQLEVAIQALQAAQSEG